MDKTFKTGDKIVRYSRIWRIFKIKTQKGLNGDKEKILFYKPVFPKNKNGKISFSIPVANIENTNIRRPISKDKANTLLKLLKKKPETKEAVDFSKTADKLEQNIFTVTIETLRAIWWNKRESVNFTKSQEGILDMTIKTLSEEIAFIYGLSVSKASQKIKGLLKEKNKED